MKPTLSPSKQCVENGDAQPEEDIKKDPLKFLTWNTTSLLIRMSAAGSKGAPKVPGELKDDTSSSREEKQLIEFQQVKKHSNKGNNLHGNTHRINNYLAKQRNLLPTTTKMDKVSLFAEVIQHAKELKRKTCLIAETSVVPTEMDELTVDASNQEAWN
ncbi:transcription factor AIG1-like [Hibiscus syriacus]|uniref:transcription factor AIG1-like n=1 Tax=Hibiscus syriacus TaxID=106335 RepID=UPI0019205836|nr:transcription factor AIG1-like [Hibiscus syriacus]